jgi:hypothetical protein
VIDYRAHPLASARLPYLRPRHGRGQDAPWRVLAGIAATGTAGAVAAYELGRIWRRRMSSGHSAAAAAGALPSDAAAVARESYESVLPAEQAAFNVLAAFACTTAGARLVNYLRDQRRRVQPLARLRGDGGHVHHFVPGIALAFGSGGGALLTSDARRRPILALLFGTGVGLTLDEAALLVRFEDRYWSSEQVSLAQMLLGVAAAGALGLRFARRGERRALP